MSNELDEKDVLVYQGQLGLQVEAFLNSDVGAYLIARSEQESHSLMEKLKKADPSDCVGIIRIQEAIKRSESFKEWLVEAVENGLKATEVLQQREE